MLAYARYKSVLQFNEHVRGVTDQSVRKLVLKSGGEV